MRQVVRIVSEPTPPGKNPAQLGRAVHVFLEDGSEIDFCSLTLRVAVDEVIEADVGVFPGALDVQALAAIPFRDVYEPGALQKLRSERPSAAGPAAQEQP